MAIGFTGIAIYFITRLVKKIIRTREFKIEQILELMIVLMSVTLFSRYLYHTFWDITGILIVPLYLLILIFVFIKHINQDHKLISTNVLFVLLTIPLFGLDFHKGPRKLIPTDWYDRYVVDEPVKTSLPWKYETHEAYLLGEKGFQLMKSSNYVEAIEVFKSGIKIEQNPRFYFDISACYARTNELEIAINYLDTLIILDPNYAGTYNNRGLLYYHRKDNNSAIQDYHTAIRLDSANGVYHSNLALAYYVSEDYSNACKEFGLARELNTSSIESYSKIIQESCNKNP